MNNINNLEQIITDAVEEAKQHECHIVRGDWGVDWDEKSQKWKIFGKCCCPMGAVLLKHQPKPCEVIVDGNEVLYINMMAAVSSFLGVPEAQVEGFIAEFDNSDVKYPSHDTFEDLGNKFAFTYCVSSGPEEDEEEYYEVDDEDLESEPEDFRD